MRMSERLRTPIGRPAASMTGAAVKPRPVSSLTASRIVAVSRIEIGLGVIRSAAVSARKTNSDDVDVVMAVLLSLRMVHQHWDGGAADYLVRHAAQKHSGDAP